MQRPKLDGIFKILPFGHYQIEFKGEEEKRESELGLAPRYGEPGTTNQKIVEVIFGGGAFKVPKTTAGDF